MSEPQAYPTSNSVVIEWPKVDGAVVYTIEIKKKGELLCTLSFNESGQGLLKKTNGEYARQNQKGGTHDSRH